MPFMDAPRRFQKLFNALVPHDPHDGYKPKLFLLRIRLRAVLLQIYPGAGDHLCHGVFLKAALLAHKRQIPFILEKNAARIF